MSLRLYKKVTGYKDYIVITIYLEKNSIKVCFINYLKIIKKIGTHKKIMSLK
mgnify:FL=1